MAGIKETKEVLLFTKLLAVFVAKRLSDGAGLDDLYALVVKAVGDAEFQAAASAAFADVADVAIELSDLDFAEISELGKEGIDIVAQVLAALKS